MSFSRASLITAVCLLAWMSALPPALAQGSGAVLHTDSQSPSTSTALSLRSALDAVAAREGSDYNFLAVTHGYSIEFEEGSWGARGYYSLPVDLPLAVSGGIDYYPEGEFTSMTTLGVDLSCSLPMDAIGTGNAFLGAGPRLYRSTSGSGSASSSNTELAFGIDVGATYPIGPVAVYGDVGVDRVYGNLALNTRFGLAYEFGGR